LEGEGNGLGQGRGGGQRGQETQPETKRQKRGVVVKRCKIEEWGGVKQELKKNHQKAGKSGIEQKHSDSGKKKREGGARTGKKRGFGENILQG